MKTSYDKAADILYVEFSAAEIDGSEEVRPGVILDFDRDGRIVGIEVLDAGTTMASGAIVGLQAAE